MILIIDEAMNLATDFNTDSKSSFSASYDSNLLE
jgi:hypothetical protein